LYGHLVNVVVIWYIFPRFGILVKDKSGNRGNLEGIFTSARAQIVIAMRSDAFTLVRFRLGRCDFKNSFARKNDYFC
jgi:hypothetical protein